MEVHISSRNIPKSSDFCAMTVPKEERIKSFYLSRTSEEFPRTIKATINSAFTNSALSFSLTLLFSKEYTLKNFPATFPTPPTCCFFKWKMFYNQRTCLSDQPAASKEIDWGSWLMGAANYLQRSGKCVHYWN